MKNKTMKVGIIFAILAATFYAISSPISKKLLNYMPSTLMAGFLYLGAGVGMVIIYIIKKIIKKEEHESKLTKNELPYVIGMVLLDILAPISLLYGLKYTSAATTSLLNNFEIVATALIAFIIFKEKVSGRLWVAICLVTLSCVLLSIEDISNFTFSYGALFIIIASICWGLENNCTRKISSKDPLQIVCIKGLCSGLGSIIIGLCIGEKVNVLWSVFVVALVGFVAYGLSIFFYVYAQRYLGAARTSAYYAISPFIGSLLAMIIFKEFPNYLFIAALVLMAIGAYLASGDQFIIKRKRKVE